MLASRGAARIRDVVSEITGWRFSAMEERACQRESSARLCTAGSLREARCRCARVARASVLARIEIVAQRYAPGICVARLVGRRTPE